MPRVKVLLGSRSYSVRIGSGTQTQVGPMCRRLCSGRQAALVTTSKLYRLHGKTAERSLRKAGYRSKRMLVTDGEKSKSVKQVERLYTRFAAAGLERSDPVVVVGGGTLGDTAGFAAATFLRGLPLIHVPTTLMAQVDSAIGGKTGVNLSAGKNLAGAIWQPRAVICDQDTLATLPRRQVAAGLAEVIKYACIARPDLMLKIRRNVPRLLGKTPDVDAALVTACVRIKAAIVSKDESEQDQRRVLNFGHTFGHAVEHLSGYTLLHGEAVALGLMVALELSVRLRKLDVNFLSVVHQSMRRIFPRLAFPNFRHSALTRTIRHDKKVKTGRPVWVLLDQPGRPVMVQPSDAAVHAAWQRARDRWNSSD